MIPKGQYGAGTVMVWDTGTYDPMDDNIPLEQQLARRKIISSSTASSCVEVLRWCAPASPGSTRMVASVG